MASYAETLPTAAIGPMDWENVGSRLLIREGLKQTASIRERKDACQKATLVRNINIVGKLLNNEI